ncbi:MULTISPECIES: hypothetical protein [Acidithiobacillus]|nr:MULTISPECIES: hypothetical protein [Acidithiobacillus]
MARSWRSNNSMQRTALRAREREASGTNIWAAGGHRYAASLA